MPTRIFGAHVRMQKSVPKTHFNKVKRVQYTYIRSDYVYSVNIRRRLSPDSLQKQVSEHRGIVRSLPAFVSGEMLN